jgi:hypothetical protein
MDVMSVPEASYPGRVEAELACEMCFKSYQRRAYLLPNLRFSSSSCPSPFPILILPLPYNRLLPPCLIVPMQATCSCAIAGSARVPESRQTVAKPAMRAFKQRPSVAIPSLPARVVSSEEQSVCMPHPQQSRSRII